MFLCVEKKFLLSKLNKVFKISWKRHGHKAKSRSVYFEEVDFLKIELRGSPKTVALQTYNDLIEYDDLL